MQRKQQAAIKRKVEAADNIAPRRMPALVQRVELAGDLGVGIVCAPEDWNRMTKVRTEKRVVGS